VVTGQTVTVFGVGFPAGSTVELTIDKFLQYTVEEALRDGVTENRALSGTAIVMDPNSGVTVTWGLRPGEPGYADALAKMERNSTVWDIASLYSVQDVILPHTTRDYLIRMLDVHRLRKTHGVGQHLMRAWPTSY